MREICLLRVFFLPKGLGTRDRRTVRVCTLSSAVLKDAYPRSRGLGTQGYSTWPTLEILRGLRTA